VLKSILPILKDFLSLTYILHPKLYLTPTTDRVGAVCGSNHNSYCYPGTRYSYSYYST